MQNSVLNVRKKKKKLVKNYKIFFLITITSFFIDQISKLLIRHFFEENISYRIFKYFSITYIKNKGVCFGFLNYYILKIPLIIGSILIFLLIFMYVFKNKTNSKVIQVSSGFIEGGILGNLIDRIRFGAVVDFLNFHIWPVFNFSDSFIVIGVSILFFYQIRQGKTIK